MGEYKNVPQEINNVVQDNLEKLAQLFPSAVKDGQLDVNALKEELGTFEEVGKEKYEFTWSGKQNAKKIAQQDIFGKTLKFCPEKSKNADTTENIYIEGDNLEALKLLRQNYYNSIKMIYIDPPYNTGNDFVYNDDYSMSQEESDLAEGVVDELGERYTKNLKSSNKFHAKWLNEMYPRLKLAKDLLTDDGVIFISMDDNEIDNLKKLCNEIFNEDNFCGQYMWYRSATPPNLSYKIKKNLEYILCYQKKKDSTKFRGIKKVSKSSDPITKPQNTIKILRFPSGSLTINLPNQVVKAGVYGTEKFPNVLINDLIIENGTNANDVSFENRFIWKQETLDENIAANTTFYLSKQLVISYKKSDYSPEVPPNFIDMSVNVNTTEEAGKALDELFDNITVFDYPKPVSLLKYLIGFLNLSSEDIIMDFFSGSGTTAQAIFELNSLSNLSSKFILVQLPENLERNLKTADGNSKKTIENAIEFCEQKELPHTIASIAEERIRRAGDKIAEECQAKIDEYKSKLEVLANNPNGKGIPVEEDEPYPIPDIGFKVFEIADTNIKWNELELKDEQIDFANLSNNPDQVDFKQGIKDIDVVYEIMLRQKNIPLSSKVEVLDEIGSRTYLYADSYLICLETQVTNEMIDKLASLDPTPFKYIFRDSAFKDDIDLKTNAFRRLKAMVEKHAGATKKAYTVEFI